MKLRCVLFSFTVMTFAIATLARPLFRQPLQRVDCLGLTQKASAINAPFSAMSQADRRQCLDQLSLSLSDSSALALSELASKGLIDDPVVVHRLMECLSSNLNTIGQYCNRALWYLTGHPYGTIFFERSMFAPPFTAENHALAVADWREYDNLLAKDHWIFDAALVDECDSALRGIHSRLVETLSAYVPNHVLIGYLKTRLEGRGRIVEFPTERLFFFGLGEERIGPGFAEPANWSRSDNNGLQGIRILMLRPGIPHPVSPIQTDLAIQTFPASAADYDEVFKALDLEVRFQIVTSNNALRRAAIERVKEALSALRERNRRS